MTQNEPEKPNAVVFCVDDKMIFPALVAADEAATVAGAENYEVIVIAQSGCVPPEFSRWHAERGDRFRLTEMDITAPSLQLGFKDKKRVTLASLFKIHIPKLFRDQYKRILYLDADIEIRGSLNNLFSLEMSGHPFAASDGLGLAFPDEAGMQGRRTLMLMQKAGWHSANHDPKYANAGVILFDVQNWLDQAITERALNFLVKNFNGTQLDQDAINVAASGEYCRLSPAWNYLDGLLKDFCPPFDPVIIHYAGNFKPWDTINWHGDSKAAGRYEHFFANSPWPEAPPLAEWQRALADERSARPNVRQGPKRHAEILRERNFKLYSYLKNTRFSDVEQGLISFKQLG